MREEIEGQKMELKQKNKYYKTTPPQCISSLRKLVAVWLFTANGIEHDVEVEENKQGTCKESDADHLGTAVHTLLTMFLLH